MWISQAVISIIGLYHMEVLYIYKVLLLLYEDPQIYFTDNLKSCKINNLGKVWQISQCRFCSRWMTSNIHSSLVSERLYMKSRECLDFPFLLENNIKILISFIHTFCIIELWRVSRWSRISLNQPQYFAFLNNTRGREGARQGATGSCCDVTSFNFAFHNHVHTTRMI